MKVTQQDRVYNFIELIGGVATTNQIRDFCHENFIADGTKRARELVAQGKLQRRDMSTYEMERRHLSTKVKIFFIAG